MILGIDDIMRALPHRYPFLMVDKVLELEKDKSITATKMVTATEPHFQGHFPDMPIMPGVLIVESLAQTCALLAILSADLKEAPKDAMFLLTGLEGCRFRRLVKPGDCLFLHAKLKKQMRQFMRFETRAEVDGELACELILTSALKR